MQLYGAVIKFSAFAAAIVAISSGAWEAGDYTGIRPALKRELEQIAQEADQNSRAVLLLQFQLLMQKRQYGGLNFDEQQQLCQIARTLQYVGVPGC